jgi:hypothetical protein
MNDKLIAFALDFLASNISDSEVEAALAVRLGLAKNEEEYWGESFDKIFKLIENAKLQPCDKN